MKTLQIMRQLSYIRIFNKTKEPFSKYRDLYPARFFSQNQQQSSKIAYEQLIASLKSKEEVNKFLQDESQNLSKEHYCQILELLVQSFKGQKQAADEITQQTLSLIFKDSLQNFEPIYVASIIDSLNQLNGDYQQNYRVVEKLLSRGNYFGQLQDLGIIAIILDKYTQIPHQFRQLDLEEVLEKAELQLNTIFKEMLGQRKLPEDIGFHSQDLVSIVNSFQISFAGNTDFYEKAQALAIKFKYTFKENDIVRLVYSLVQMKIKISQELKDQLRNIQRGTYQQGQNIEDLSISDKLKFNQIISVLNILAYNTENEFITDRAELSIDLKPFIPAKQSYKVFLKEGETYLYCTCGASNNQPFCDGSHKDLQGFKPLKFTHQQEDKIIGLCGCKLNKVEKGAYCDGSHKKIDYDSIEKVRLKFI